MSMPPEQMPGMMGVPQQAPAEQVPEEEDAFGPQEDDTESDAVFEEVVAGLREHIFGKGEDGISERLRASDDLVMTIAELTFVLCSEAIRQGEENGIETDIEIMVGVATYVIDDLIALSEALGLELGDTDQLREGALYGALMHYMDSSETSDEQRAEAQQLLAQLQSEGLVDEAAAQIQKSGEKAGVQPFAQGQQIAPQQPQQIAPTAPPLMGG